MDRKTKAILVDILDVLNGFGTILETVKSLQYFLEKDEISEDDWKTMREERKKAIARLNGKTMDYRE